MQAQPAVVTSVKKEVEPAQTTAEERKADEPIKDASQPPKMFDLSDPSQMKFPYDRQLLIEKIVKLN